MQWINNFVPWNKAMLLHRVRHAFLGLSVLLAISIAPAFAQSPAPTTTVRQSAAPIQAGPSSRVVTMTYLKSKPARLALLERYIRANWFEMDAVAVEQGLFVSHEWLDTGSDSGDWNAIVIVTYNDEQGFEGIQSRWATIRSSHKDIFPDGLAMRELGRVVESKTLFERAPFVIKQSMARAKQEN